MEGVDPAAAAAMRARRVAARTIRVRTTWLDGLLDRIHDLQLVSQRLHVLNPPVARSPMGEAVGELGRLLDEVHAEALSARMSAFSTLAQRLPRVVRDLARQAGKRATMLVRGGDELLDRAIIEGLDGPITHLLRNAIDHGIERPEARAAANKPVTGVLTLSCLRVRDEIIVELADDGRGIDRAAVAARAVELGMAEPSVAAHDAEHDLGRLLALPGLTTRRTAGVLAGRGVGLDAVQAELAALGGTLAMTTRPGQGSVFRLHLPRTPGITRLLMVEADGQLYGLPQARVVRTAWFDAAAVERLENGTLMVHEDEPHRLLSLRTLLDLPEAPLPQKFRGVVLRDPRGPLVVAVDRVEGQQEAVVKPLGPLLEQFEGLTGVTVGASNQPVFVLDIARLAGVPTTL
jgi:two-component system chemotaxis sensor kinase CheA